MTCKGGTTCNVDPIDGNFGLKKFSFIFGGTRKIWIRHMSLVNSTPRAGRIMLTFMGLFFVWFSVWVLVTPFYNDPCVFTMRYLYLYLFRLPCILSRQEMGDPNPSDDRSCTSDSSFGVCR